MIVVDTTVLVYAVGGDHPLAEPCRELVRHVGDGRIRATTTVEVLQEFAHVRARRRGRADAAELTRAYHTLFAPLLPCDGEDLEAGMELFGQHPELGAFDAVLAATASRGGASTLVSADRAFAAVQELRVLDPAADDFLDRLGAR